MFTCSKCMYHTTIKCNFLKHLNRKTSCIKQSYVDQNHILDGQNHILEGQNHIDDLLETDGRSFIKCSGCEKVVSKRKFTRHERSCKGVPKNTCIHCKRTFVSQPNHSKHQKICKLNCSTLLDPVCSSNIVSGSTIYKVDTLIQHQTNIINININPFGQENISYLLDKRSLDLVYSWTKKSINGMLDCCTHIYFNNDFPENQTIRYLNKKDPFVHVYDGKDWLPQFKEQALIPLVKNIEATFVTFFRDIKLLVRDNYEATRHIRKFCKEVACSFDWDIEVFESIFNISRIEPINNEDVEKRTNRLHALIMEHIHLQSNKIYSNI